MSELYTPAPDSFEQERPMQPKKTVGDYVDSQGILVPRRFETFEEAQFAAQNGTSVLARSEHPDEYSGPSGLGNSSPFVEDLDDLLKPRHHIRGRDFRTGLYERYIRTSGAEEPGSYLSKISESYWESIKGVNVTVIADDAVEDRYHIFGHRYRGEPGSLPTMVTGAIVEENGDIQRITHSGERDDEFPARFKEIIDFYNQIRRLDRFNAAHCPVVEIQLSDEDDQLYFLQYHRARDAAPSSERLDPSEYDEREGWVKADAVRGVLLGTRTLDLAIRYQGMRGGTTKSWLIDLPEDGSASGDYTFLALDELIGRQRIAHLIPSNFDNEYDKIAAHHGPRSRMFKPQVSLLTNPSRRHDYISEELQEEATELAYGQDKEVRIKTDVASDGRDGYFRFTDELVVVDHGRLIVDG